MDRYCPSAMRVRPPLACALALLVAGCGKGTDQVNQPRAGIKGTEKEAAQGLGFPQFATKNTTRIGGADAIADAAAVARAALAPPDARRLAVARFRERMAIAPGMAYDSADFARRAAAAAARH